MTLAQLTWQPDNIDGPETLTVDLPAERITEMQDLIGTADWVRSEAVMPIPTRGTNGRMEPRLYRLARITAIQAA